MKRVIHLKATIAIVVGIAVLAGLGIWQTEILKGVSDEKYAPDASQFPFKKRIRTIAPNFNFNSQGEPNLFVYSNFSSWIGFSGDIRSYDFCLRTPENYTTVTLRNFPRVVDGQWQDGEIKVSGLKYELPPVEQSLDCRQPIDFTGLKS